jgi:uncharacterized beta-barrel protein YwiB (DUF1934 family)
MKQVEMQIVTTMRKLGQTIEQTCLGKLGQKGTEWVLLYKEDLGDGQVVTATIKVESGKATIIRTGAVRMRQEYVIGRWTEGKYDGPFGSMWMETKTERIEFTGDLFALHYRLKLNGEDMGRYDVRIELRDGTDKEQIEG